MTMLDAIRPLIDHMEWADATVWRAAGDYAGAADDKVLHVVCAFGALSVVCAAARGH